MYWPSLGDLDNFHFDFADLPCLQHVKLVGTSFKLTLPTTITVLQLSHVNLTGRLGLLAELPNLIKLETTQVVAGSFAFEVTNTAMEQIVLHRLEPLTWRDMRVIGNHEFLRFVHFVHLTTLVWDERTYLDEFLSEKRQVLRLAFFSSLPSTLSSLTIRDIEIDSPNLVDLLGSIPQLAKLHFIRSPRPVVIGAVEAIGRPPANRGASSSSSTILSNLSVLSVSDIRSGVDALVFVGMLEALHATGPRPKRFHLTTHSDVEWHADALHRVQDLLTSGLNARVTFDSGGSTSSVP
ncbi:hypothetical protein AGABI1DRAFT_131352 [Agaricus bisporus var. burnettii JB137-S8]|uniref:F-box domain-containing protein n=1 Tax=Agaricus bisporus var. burnettii (strain JB137-S8 / ATCC MYA-4627 / FGSC 10392) TaxID=597362 RepID=K5WMI7_AGABU|nr:uncharacterized protein AGABI1DRAFT_131352 [Agaricus bisporus var. burnettii JB137-S8]EKM76531.1 hypothetical protein AGABI1DRAFT_131352 [Agaricus bisporus var. burnettii JB137-S8]